VRSLEREIASVCRKVARKVVQSGASSRWSVPRGASELLGKRAFRPVEERSDSEIGVSTGLAWTEVGGEIWRPRSV
jgi:ATP-dependent Lon protease